MKDSQIVDLVAISPDQIWPSLKSCLAWYKRKGDRDPVETDWGTEFRSPELVAAATRVFPDSCHTPFRDSMSEAMASFLAERAERIPTLEGPKLGNEQVEGELYRPHALLVTDWSASLFDGALEPETNGFIDFDGLPPWDTWIGLVRVEDSVGEACLLSWVPPWAEHALLKGINVDASGCYTWATLQPEGVHETTGWRRI